MIFRPERSFSPASSKKGTRPVPVPAPAASVWGKQLPGLLGDFPECLFVRRVGLGNCSGRKLELSGRRFSLILACLQPCFQSSGPCPLLTDKWTPNCEAEIPEDDLPPHSSLTPSIPSHGCTPWVLSRRRLCAYAAPSSQWKARRKGIKGGKVINRSFLYPGILITWH